MKYTFLALFILNSIVCLHGNDKYSFSHWKRLAHIWLSYIIFISIYYKRTQSLINTSSKPTKSTKALGASYDICISKPYICIYVCIYTYVCSCLHLTVYALASFAGN